MAVSIAISEIFSVKEWPEPGLGLFKVIDNDNDNDFLLVRHCNVPICLL